VNGFSPCSSHPSEHPEQEELLTGHYDALVVILSSPIHFVIINTMYEITYYSLAKSGLTADDISHILKTSRTYNAQNGITGCLLYHKNQFIQILEGEKKTIGNLFSSIKRDARHTNVFVLAESEKEERAFADWTMAYHELSDDEAKNISDKLFVNNVLTFSALALKPTFPVKTFWIRVQRLLTDDYTT
jgi:hypothetical protein